MTKVKVTKKGTAYKTKSREDINSEILNILKNSDSAEQYAIFESLTYMAAADPKPTQNELLRYCCEKIGEYKAYNKAYDVINNELFTSHRLIEQINSIITAAYAYEDSYNLINHNILMGLFGAIETITKAADDTVTLGENKIMAIIKSNV